VKKFNYSRRDQRPASAATPVPLPAKGAPPSATAPPPPPTPPTTGFGASLRNIVARKLREFTGARWEGVSERDKTREATRRGVKEMARRIERETGKRPAESTIRRNAGRNATPRGVDQERLDRQARIDEAGGFKRFAERAGISKNQAVRWRDTGGPLAPFVTYVSGILRVMFDVTCNIFHVGPRGRITPLYNRRLDNNTDPLYGAPLQIDEPDASTLAEAYAMGDTEEMRNILGDYLAMKVVSMWPGRPGRTVDVTVLHNILLLD
jgi:hypothetical protein